MQDFVDSVKAAEGITFNSSIYLSLSDHLLGTIDEYIRAVGMAKSGEAVEHGACLLTIV